jgi:hypothetical protein
MISIRFLAALAVAFGAIYLLRNRYSADATHSTKSTDRANSSECRH